MVDAKAFSGRTVIGKKVEDLKAAMEWKEKRNSIWARCPRLVDKSRGSSGLAGRGPRAASLARSE